MIRNENPRGDAISTKSKASHLPTVLREEQALEQERIPLAENFVYGTVGNRLRGPGREDASVYNELNQLLASRTEDFRYDANGSLTFRAGFADDDDYGQQSWSYEYDLENRLAKAVKVGEHGNRVVSFKYDPFGRRIEKKVEEIEDGIAEVRTTAYVYDNEDIILEISGNSTSRYVHGPGIDEPLAVEQNGMVYYYHADGLGSTVSLTDQGGRVAQSYEYDSFGNMRQYGGAVKQPFGYTGREWDKELGLYYYRARYYDPKGGMFISKDPIGFAGGDVNLYRYVQNNPVNRIDPTGLSDVTFDRGAGTITIYNNQGSQVGQYPAGNNTTSTSNGPWPDGTYDYSHYVPHPESGLNGPYGSNGNFVFDVPGRTGMGIHSGRRGPRSKTEGCIRTTDEATDFLRDLNSADPLKTITVK